MKTAKRLLSTLLIVVMLFSVFAVEGAASASAAAKQQSKTYSYCPLEAKALLKQLDVYGKDTITFKYNGTKVISSSAKQTAKSLGTKLIEKGGIKLTSSKAGEHKYKSVWYINFDVLPGWALKLAAKYLNLDVGKISNLGKCATVTVEYTVTKTGAVKKAQTYKLYCPTKLKKYSKQLDSFIKKYLVK